MNTLTISALFCAFIALIFAIVTATKSLKEKRYLWFSILCGMIALWNSFFFASRILHSPLFERFHALLTVLLAPCAAGFFLHFVEKIDEKHTKFQKRLTSIYVISIALALGVFLPQGDIFFFLHSVSFYATCVIGYAFYLLYENLKKANLDINEKKRQKYLILGGIVTLMMLVFDRLTEAGLPLTSFGNVFLIVYLYFVYQIITKRKVVDIEDLTAKGVLFFSLAAILTFIYAILVSWVEGPALFLFNTFVASFVILVLFEPIKSTTEKLTNNFFLKGRRQTKRYLNQVKSKLLEVSDLRDLTHEVLVGLKNAYQATQAHFFLLDQDELTFRRLQSLDQNAANLVSEILVGDDFMKYVQRKHPVPASQTYLTQEILESSRILPKERLENVLKGFEKLNCEVAFGFMLDHKLLGFGTFTNAKTDTPYSLSKLSNLESFGKQIAYTIRNLKVYDRIREKDRMATLGEMSAGLAHEIKNPLGAIKGAAQYLQPDPQNATQSEFLNIIIDEVNRLDKVVNQFLNYAKPFPQNLEEVNIVDVVKNTLQKATPDIPKQFDLTFETEAPSIMVMADAQQMSQVFLNMILNSVSSMSDRGLLKIQIRLKDKTVEISFEDTGEGIAPEDLKRIFVPFFTTKDSGTGLGLPISQKIVKAHQGDIYVDSQIHEGTKFTITLPRTT